MSFIFRRQCDLLHLILAGVLVGGTSFTFFLSQSALFPVYADSDTEADVLDAKIQETDTTLAAGAYNLPTGTMLRVTLLTKLTSQTAFKGQMIEARISQPIYTGENQILGPGDKLVGHVEASLMPRLGQNGLIAIKFDELVLDNSFKYPLFATTITYQNHSYFGGEGTDGSQPERILYRNKGVPDYDGFVLRGDREMGVNYTLNPGDQLTLRLEKVLRINKPNN